MTITEGATLPPPEPYDDFRWYADNIADHDSHEIVVVCRVHEVLRTVIERTTERFFDEGDFTIYAVKNIHYEVENQQVHCETCRVQLDIPNGVEWAT